MKKIKLGKQTLFLSIATLLTIVSWVSFETYRAATQTTINPATQKQMAPLSPQIDRELIDDLKETLVFTDEELNLVPTPTLSVEASQATTESGILEQE